MAKEIIKVPDIGGAENVEVIEVTVAVGDSVKAEDSLVVLESDKASMDIPAPRAGKVTAILLKLGDKVSQGSAILELEIEGQGEAAAEKSSEPEKAAAAAPGTASTASTSDSNSGGEIPVAVPDIGGAENVDVIEVSVKVGDEVKEGDSIVVLESDKASMEIPAPAAGKVVSIAVKEGDKVSQGSAILVLAGASAQPAREASPKAPTQEASAAGSVEQVKVPDIGGAEGVDVIEVCIAEGDEVNEGDALVVLESDKASMEIPAPMSGKVKSLRIKEGDKVSMGTLIAEFEVAGGKAPAAGKELEAKAPAAQGSETKSSGAADRSDADNPASSGAKSQDAVPRAGADVYAGPAVRKLARQLGVNLKEVKSSGPRGRVLKEDVRSFVKAALQSRSGGAASGASGIPPVPAVDFGQFGEIELVKMSKIKKLTANNMSRNWLNVPHVTQFDDADITEMEAFRQSMKAEAEKAGTKLTPVPFLLKACAAALKAEPMFNVSLHHDGEHIVQKKYIHIGMAVDTPAGLMVPVIRDVDKKGLLELSAEVIELAKKARDGKLLPKEMQGGCFTISSLGAIGGRGFTPIVNAPEVSILGVSRSDTRPVWDGKQFVPRLMLPLCLSYDHRAINGSDAGRFLTLLCSLLGDIRRLLI